MIILITLQQLYIYYNIHTVFKLGSVIYSNVLKEVSSAQKGCSYLYRKKYMPDSRRGLKNGQKYYFSNLLLINFKLNCALLV